MSVTKTKSGIHKVSLEDSRWILRADGNWDSIRIDNDLGDFERSGKFFNPDMHAGIDSYLNEKIKHAKDGYYHKQKLSVGIAHVYFKVEDTAYFVNHAEYFPTYVKLHLNDGTREHLRPETLYIEDFVHPETEQIDEDMLYCFVKKGKHKARFEKSTRNSFLQRLEISDDKLILPLEKKVLEFPNIDPKLFYE